MQNVIAHESFEEAICNAIRWTMLMFFLSIVTFSSCGSQLELMKIRKALESQQAPAKSEEG